MRFLEECYHLVQINSIPGRSLCPAEGKATVIGGGHGLDYRSGFALGERDITNMNQALLERSCAVRHRQTGMETGLLARRIDVALLEERDDLSADYIIQTARIGVGKMSVDGGVILQ